MSELIKEVIYEDIDFLRFFGSDLSTWEKRLESLQNNFRGTYFSYPIEFTGVNKCTIYGQRYETDEETLERLAKKLNKTIS